MKLKGKLFLVWKSCLAIYNLTGRIGLQVGDPKAWKAKLSIGSKSLKRCCWQKGHHNLVWVRFETVHLKGINIYELSFHQDPNLHSNPLAMNRMHISPLLGYWGSRQKAGGLHSLSFWRVLSKLSKTAIAQLTTLLSTREDSEELLSLQGCLS